MVAWTLQGAATAAPGIDHNMHPHLGHTPRTARLCARLSCCAAALWFGATAAPAALSPERLIVVYNSRAPGSKEVADHYCLGRDIPPERVLAVQCGTEEKMSRAEFESAIRAPLAAWLQEKGLMKRVWREFEQGGKKIRLELPTHNEVHGVVLCWGVPAQIDEDATLADPGAPAQFRTTAAAVDSELALLPVSGIRLSGAVPNPMFRNTQGFDTRAALSMVLVTRLDGPTPDVVRARLDEAWRAERAGLVGRACFDIRGISNEGYKQGDEWLRRAAQATARWGMPTATEETDSLAGAGALWSDVALYAGWYAETLGGALATPDFRFRPGAVAYHIHSYSASKIRAPQGHWVGPLLARGAAATMGAVMEPYLSLTPYIDLFVEQLLAGRTFAEAAYASQPVLSWMITVVGDPLYRPFPQFPESWLQQGLARPGPDNPWYFFISANRRKTAANLGSMFAEVERFLEGTRDPLAWELGGDFFTGTFEPDKALAMYRKAAAAAPPGPVATRLQLKAVRILIDRRRFADAWAALDHLDLNSGGDPSVRATAEALSQRPDAAPISAHWRIALMSNAPAPGTPAGTLASPSPSAAPTPAQPAPSIAPPTLAQPQLVTPHMQFPKLERPQLRPPVLEPGPGAPRPQRP